MTARELLHALQARDVRLTVQGDALAYDAPDGSLTAELLDVLRQHKTELLGLLAYKRFRDFVELWEERAAVMQYEASLTGDDAEYQAFLCVKEQYNVLPQ
jgi:hypothetical protein